jgi:hypothetical protein
MSRFESGDSEETPSRAVDKSKRYDMYCSEQGMRIIAYRNVRFIGVKWLFGDGQQFDIMNQYLEIEQASGAHIFIARHGILRFCEHGTQVLIEDLQSKPN